LKSETKNIEQRRFEGEFYTPINFAKKGLDYIEKTIGKEWWKTGEYRLWDMASGTGNLEYNLPTEALEYCYLSTIYKEDVEYCSQNFPTANCFQYDYLNDDIELLFNNFAKVQNLGEVENWKLPQKLRNDLLNPKIKWIILVNPPYATSQKAGTSGKSKQGVSETKIREVMHLNNLGEDSRELLVQFLFRIKYEFKNKTAYLALFSKINYLNANNNQKFRDTVFNFQFISGFLFSSANFSGTSKTSPFPIGFMIWNLSKSIKIENQNIVTDVFNDNFEIVSQKTITSENKTNFLSKWIERPVANIKFPPLSSAIELKLNNKDKRDRISEGFLMSLMCKGNDLQNQQYTALLSAPYVSAGALSVTAQNFEKAMIIHAVRRIPQKNWLNSSNQFLQPVGKLTDEFITDCTIWNLFSSSNQTASLKNIDYENEIYQIKNQFFPFQISEIKTWQCNNNEIIKNLENQENRFLANWLINKKLSNQSQELLNKGTELYLLFYENINKIELTKFKIESWDAGWWQIRNSLKNYDLAINLFNDLKILHKKLSRKLIEQIIDYKFIGTLNIRLLYK